MNFYSSPRERLEFAGPGAHSSSSERGINRGPNIRVEKGKCSREEKGGARTQPRPDEYGDITAGIKKGEEKEHWDDYVLPGTARELGRPLLDESYRFKR